MEISHTNFAEITRMVFVKVDTMMVHATSITATSRMLTVFTNTTMTVTYMTTKLSGLLPLDIRLNQKIIQIYILLQAQHVFLTRVATLYHLYSSKLSVQHLLTDVYIPFDSFHNAFLISIAQDILN